MIDFFRALRADPTRLRVLGDGRQRKSYLYVSDCVNAILTALAAHEGEPGMAVYNLGTDESIVVDESIGVICGHLGVTPGARAHRRHARLGRRQPADPSRHGEDPRARAGSRRSTSATPSCKTLEWLRRAPDDR